LTSGAGITKAAWVAIVANQIIGSIDATTWRERVAGIGGASITIIAGLHHTATDPHCAKVTFRTLIAVITRAGVLNVLAARNGMTEIVGTSVSVGTILSHSTLTVSR
jgi:hypothetical protein